MTPALPNITILATGGTIAGSGASTSESAYSSATVHVDELIHGVPTLAELAHVSGEQVAQVGSQDITDELWLTLARRARACLEQESVDGVVITHGTDTLEESAFFLDQVLPRGKPVVLTGAMRPATGLSADGPRNILDSVRVATNPEAAGRGVLVVLDEVIHTARGVIKTNTARVSTFQSPDLGAAGAIVAGRTSFFRRAAREEPPAAPDLADLESLPRVDILYGCAGGSADLVQASVERGARGIVLAGVGNGNASAPVLEALAEAVRQGLAVVRSTRAPSGFVARNMEVDDDELGFVAAGSLGPAKARVLLRLALLETSAPERLQERFFAI